MKYKLIASDFDGTLANSKDEITPVTKKAIAAYRKAGGIFCVSTGRSVNSVMLRMGELGLKDGKDIPLISFQGALITDALSGKTIIKTVMDKRLVIDIALYGEKHGYYFHVYTEKNIFAAEDCDTLRQYADYTQTEKDVIITGNKLSDFIENSGEQFIKVIFINMECDMGAVSDELNAAFRGRVIFTRSSKFLVECVDDAAGKGNALKSLAAHYNINISETLAIGDSMNDYSMIEAAGLGVAVSNADEKLKGAAKHITCSNDENAVAKIIDQVINDKL